MALAVLGAVSCASAPEGPRAPREVRFGTADHASQYVEAEVRPDEIAAAVQTLISAAPVCTPWPTLWLERTGRRTHFLVRYDLMSRDWGGQIAAASTERMEEFVAMGFMTRRERPDLGQGAVEYTLTPAGEAALDGSPYSGERPTFCAPAERRLVAVTVVEWVQSNCGNLRVRFSHVSDEWPSWARSETTRLRMATQWPALGYVAEGTVTLSRQWYSDRERPRDTPNGALRSVCYDQSRARIIGDDLVLFVEQ